MVAPSLKAKKLCQNITFRIPTAEGATVVRSLDVPADAALVLTMIMMMLMMMRVQNRGDIW
jgi:hypothetical protein